MVEGINRVYGKNLTEGEADFSKAYVMNVMMFPVHCN
jgi:hypothetical protein